jgi:hypothetical protein
VKQREPKSIDSPKANEPTTTEIGTAEAMTPTHGFPIDGANWRGVTTTIPIVGGTRVFTDEGDGMRW